VSELILNEEGGEGSLPSSPITVDIDALRKRFLPQAGEEYSIEDYQLAGIGIIETVRGCGQVLGELAEVGWTRIRPHITWNAEPIDNRTRWEQYCAMLWGCSRATVSKAWMTATSAIECPADMSLTTFYEILAGAESDEEADRLVDLALKNDWRSYHIRLMKRLHSAGLLAQDEWVLPTITQSGDALYVNLGKKRTRFAQLTQRGRMERIGVFLLTDGAGIKEEQQLIEGRANDEKD
jgi:hypothetical protein